MKNVYDGFIVQRTDAGHSSRIVSVRLSEAEISLLDRVATELDMTRSEILRSMIANQLHRVVEVIQTELMVISVSDHKELVACAKRYDRLMAVIESVMIEEAGDDDEPTDAATDADQ